MTVRAIRGATRVEADDREHVLLRSRELVREFLSANGLGSKDVVSILFSATPDIRSVAPALAARQLGLHDVALHPCRPPDRPDHHGTRPSPVPARVPGRRLPPR